MREFANTSAPHLRQALNSERRALHHFLEKGSRLLYHRRKIAGVEIDLILHDEEVIQFIEVKTCTYEVMTSHRISKTQLQRLHRAKAIFENRFRLPTEIVLAAVYADGIDTFVVG